MPTPTAEQLTETLAGAITIVHQLVDDYRWIRAEADLPPGHNPDRPTRLRRAHDGGPDYVPGRRFDLGIGNDEARAAYERADVLIRDAHRLATNAVTAMHALRGRAPRRIRLPKRFDAPEAAYSTARRLQWLLDDRVTEADDDTRRTAHAAAVQLTEAHAALRAILRDVDRTGEPAADRRCDNCGDPCPAGWTRRECEKCRRYRQRTGKPRMIRRHEDARRARSRRRERGEDHAENPLPRGRYVGGEWTEAS